MRKLHPLVSGLVVGALISAHTPRARACGCFAQPSAATPVVQAGERILFARDGGQVTAYIQIRYQGSADEFGWLVPLPSVPDLKLGTDELFDLLDRTTQPSYQLTTQRQFCDGSSASSSRNAFGGCFAASSSSPSYNSPGPLDAGFAADMGTDPIAVVKSSIGPFDYAVLKADDQTALLGWLNTNRYFVPTGTSDVLTPYIHPGAFFLALKLRAGESAGDIVPIIVRYASDLPMIPLILTSVGAVPDMGIQVWMLGQSRAIPRNYRHVVLDDLPIWLASETYNGLAVRAVREAPQHHAFITEYAGSSAPMVGVLDYPGRFGDEATLKAATDPGAYLALLQSSGFRFDSTLANLLAPSIPEPAVLVQEGVPPTQYYLNYDQYYWARISDGGVGDGGAPGFDAVALTDAIWARIVTPTLTTGQLFRDSPYLTRLFTALSPEDMTADPVFSENPDLPDVPLSHAATLIYPCRGLPYVQSPETHLESPYPRATTSLPGALRIETLREAGPPEIDIDNYEAITAAIGPVDHGSMSDSRGCSASDFPRGDRGLLLLVGAAMLIARRVRRRVVNTTHNR
jgi:hypothetical protein